MTQQLDPDKVRGSLKTTEHPMLTSMLYLGQQGAFEAVTVVNKAARAWLAAQDKGE